MYYSIDQSVATVKKEFFALLFIDACSPHWMWLLSFPWEFTHSGVFHSAQKETQTQADNTERIIYRLTIRDWLQSTQSEGYNHEEKIAPRDAITQNHACYCVVYHFSKLTFLDYRFSFSVFLLFFFHRFSFIASFLAMDFIFFLQNFKKF